MAKYKVWLTVKDRYGNIKDLDGGNINLALDENDVQTIVENIKDNIIVETKSPVYVPEVTSDNMLKFTLTEKSGEELKEKLEYDIDKSNDWNTIEEEDHTTPLTYTWEPME